jgi:hypothetical protein
VHQVKVYDGKGNLKEIIHPEFDCEGKTLGRTRNRPCELCGKFAKLQGNQKFCTSTCAADHKSKMAKARRENRKKEREARPIIPCEQCGEPVAPNRRKYCGKACDSKARKLIAMAKHARTAEILRTVKKEKNIKLVYDKGNVL